MSAELYDDPPTTEPDKAGTTAPSHAPRHARTDRETAVREALRPLLQPKRRRPFETPDSEIPGAPRAEPAPAFGAAAAPGNVMQGLDPDQPPRTFAEIGEDLGRRSRRSAAMVRLLDQHRQQLQTAEVERDAAYDKLAQVVPVVQETAQALREAMNARKIDEDPAHLHRLFMLNGRALDELEKVAVTLFADFLWVKSSWEQYAKTVEEARRLREGREP